MPDLRSLRVLLALLLLPGVGMAAELTIYRCTDDSGRLTLRDSPCLKGERQEARTMVRPQDPPARPPSPTPSAATTPGTGEPRASITRVVVVTPRSPMYECVAPDGSTYLSQTGEGEPRWVSTLSYGHVSGLPSHRRPGHGGLPEVARPRTLDGRVASKLKFDSVGRPTPKPTSQRPGAPSRPLDPGFHHGGGFGYGTWISDECYPLPQAEMCARLRDRRFELDRRYNSALQSERARITQEQRGIDARLSAECGGN